MSRTWRNIPASRYRNSSVSTILGSSPLEEKRHPNYTKRVRDKDNHGCTYSCPKSHRKHGIRRRRSNENDRLRKIEQHLWDNPTRKVGTTFFEMSVDDLEIVMPRSKEYQEYYW